MTTDIAAKQWNMDTPRICRGTVKSILDGMYVLADPCGRVSKARRATSCLVAPALGDQVLIADTGGDIYVLAVLSREQPGGTTVALEGDVRLTVDDGALSISARDGLSVTTPADLSLVASRLGMSGEALAAVFQTVDLFGSAVQAHLTDIRLVSKRLQSKVDSAVQQFVRRHAKVEGLDSVKAGTIKQAAKDILSLSSAFAFLKADKNVKIDGKQILMG